MYIQGYLPTISHLYVRCTHNMFKNTPFVHNVGRFHIVDYTPLRCVVTCGSKNILKNNFKKIV